MNDNTYWNNNGKHQADYELLANTIVPPSGNAGTYEGEMLRATTRLYYDYYNNGMANNTSGAVKFLIEANDKFNLGIDHELELVSYECNTTYYTEAPLAEPLETIANAVIEYVLSKDGKYTVSDVNLFDYADEDATDDDDDPFAYYDVDGDEDAEDAYSFMQDRDYDEIRFND